MDHISHQRLLMTTESMNELESDTVIEILDKIITTSSKSCTIIVSLDNSTIDQTNNINIVYTTNKNRVLANTTRNICYELLDKWLYTNIDKVEDSLNVLYLLLCVCLLYHNETEQKVADIFDVMHKIFQYTKNYLGNLRKR